MNTQQMLGYQLVMILENAEKMGSRNRMQKESFYSENGIRYAMHSANHI